mmetsp:Transcript_7252/g.10176  ORF Transcript_7252/g.10176 Transcript_7252/m.10176 type:complete len:364 (-) Transcript_7252:1255-2346(-)
MREDLKELLCELGDSTNVALDAGVVDEVAPEAKGVEELLFGELGEAVELGGPVGLRAGVDGAEGTVAELLDELARELHGLGGDAADLCHLFLDLLEVLLIDIVGGFGLLNDLAVGSLESGDQVEGVLENGAKSGNLLIVEDGAEVSIAVAEGAQVVSERLEDDSGRLVVMAGEALLELLDVHGERLLEQLSVLGLAHGHKHVLEGLQGKLSDALAVLISHVGRDNWEQRLNEGSESAAHVLADLLQDGESASLADEGIRVHRHLLLTEALDLDLHLHVVGGGWHVSGLHLEVKGELSVSNELVQKHGHELGELSAKEASALGERVLDGLILGVIVAEAALERRGQMLRDLEHVRLEWLLVFAV